MYQNIKINVLKEDETGTYYNRLRQYDPNSGRFTQSDPVGMKDGFNTYSYVANNPMRFFDPMGTVKQENSNGQKITDGMTPQMPIFIIGPQFMISPQHQNLTLDSMLEMEIENLKNQGVLPVDITNDKIGGFVSNKMMESGFGMVPQEFNKYYDLIDAVNSEAMDHRSGYQIQPESDIQIPQGEMLGWEIARKALDAGYEGDYKYQWALDTVHDLWVLLIG